MNRDELYTVKELAGAIRRSESYVYLARRYGFVMPGGLASVDEFRQWLTANPGFNTKRARLVTKGHNRS